ncbi:MAG: acyl-CoA dehydrogenase, partial [Actinobacteria bacterium]|nr:acyl-CoA dehydrogenase [Actinomycetota bacterium]
MSHYKSNLRDIEFNLFEVFGAQEYLGTDGPFAAMDPDTARMVLREVDRFATDSIWAESFADTDRTPLELSPEGDITVPDSLHQALQAFYEAGWHTLPLPAHLGGFGAPPSVRWATTELFSGGHATASLWPIGALMSMIIDRIGTEGQKTRYAEPMVERQWGGTMVLTEPDAGSDVGAGVTKAVKVEENGPDDLGSIYHIEGIKRFITSADYQGHENTVHLVLARPEGAAAGTKGLSLFIVPKFLVNEDGSLGERNGVRVSNIEKKMGIKGSATCELTMGDKAPCVGYLAGNVHDGIAQMFQVIEYARMMVGTKAMATLSTGYLNALEYAKIRVQGPDMTQM